MTFSRRHRYFRTQVSTAFLAELVARTVTIFFDTVQSIQSWSVQVHPRSVVRDLDLGNRMDFPERGTQATVDHVLVLGIEHQPSADPDLLRVIASVIFAPNVSCPRF